MSTKFNEYKNFDLSEVNKEVLQRWEREHTFEASVKNRQGAKPYVFYEGPPSANGMPGIHHVMARSIKDIFCRFQTMRGFQVHRKAGWDTHGLPVELGVEKALGITKEDIGKRITVEEYNKACRTDVMKYTGEWERLTKQMGYWVDMTDPYITYENRYIESLWYLLKQLYNKGLLYKGYTIQPYSPAAGTGLSSHELNQPGCYRDVKDTTCVAQFKLIRNQKSEFLFEGVDTELFIMAWTTTPWTLPSNTALCVGPNITYRKIRSFNPYTGAPITVLLAKDRQSAYFAEKDAELSLDTYKAGDKHVPYTVLGEYTGSQLLGVQYEQLLPWVNPGEGAFRVITGDFVTTEDGTGIVHIAPTFGADDYRVAREHGVPGLLVTDAAGNPSPLVDKTGRLFPIENLDKTFVAEKVNSDTYKEFAGRFVKNAYDATLKEEDTSLDVDICVNLKKDNRAFRIEKHVHNYPHCWRTDKPVLYYPLDSWFIRTTAVRERMIELNNTINWKPESTGTGRFGKWLENLQDWNLSRSRYWGTPLPIWVSEDKTEQICIGSVAELKAEIDKSVAAGFMTSNPYANYTAGDISAANYESFDLHRPYVDAIILVSPTGKRMMRELDLIDVWFDSGAMPYAQMHFPFAPDQNKTATPNNGALGKAWETAPYPADFIAEGVDQTRGWFFTLHAIAVMLFDSVAFKSVVSNGLVLDKNGNKMSKRLGNAVDPFETIGKYGSDPLRWYMVTNASPWENLKFDLEGIEEVKRKFFGTLYNTYSFFALYANVDGFTGAEAPVANRPELDRWILSLLNTLIKDVAAYYEDYEPTKAGRAIQDFVGDHLSNWFVRLSRKRFWGGSYSEDKISAYQTLYQCLETVSLLMAPIAPFYADKLFTDLNAVTKRHTGSVHLANYPVCNESAIDKALETRMDLAQRISSMVLSLRKKVNIKVRQPLSRVMLPTTGAAFEESVRLVAGIIKTETNIKDVEFLTDASGVMVKRIKPNFKTLGPKFGKLMKDIGAAIAAMEMPQIVVFERSGSYTLSVAGQDISLELTDVEIISEDIPGWLVANEGTLTVALDITITDDLRHEGIAREFINRIQNLRKESGLEITDRIRLSIQRHEAINASLERHKAYIANETLCESIELVDQLQPNTAKLVEIDDVVETYMSLQKA